MTVISIGDRKPGKTKLSCCGCLERDEKIAKLERDNTILLGRLQGLASWCIEKRDEDVKKLMANRRAKGLPRFTRAASKR